MEIFLFSQDHFHGHEPNWHLVWPLALDSSKSNEKGTKHRIRRQGRFRHFSLFSFVQIWFRSTHPV